MNRERTVGQRIAEMDRHINRHIDGRIVLISLILLVLLFSVSNASAITGSSSNITMNAGYGAATADTTAGSFGIRSIAPWSLVGSYDGTGAAGIFGQNFDGLSSTLSLVEPQNNRIQTSNVVRFVYNVSTGADNCKLYIDNALQGVNSYVNIGLNEFTMSSITASLHYWNISCTSGSDVRWSDTQAFTVMLLPDVDNVTNTTNVNMYIVANFTLEKTNIAKVLFNGITDMSSGGDMNNNIIFRKHSVMINSQALPMLNKSATITMYDVTYAHPIIWRNDAQCLDCTINSLTNNTLVFAVTGFSTYNITSSTALSVWDTTDSILTKPESNITIYARYTDILTNLSIGPIDSQCTISIDNSIANGSWSVPEAMLYDAGLTAFYYNISFNSSGVRPYIINCTNIIALDNVSVQDSAAVSGSQQTFAEVTSIIGNSSRSDFSSQPANLSVNAGNVTMMNLDGSAVTRAWQGYYGEVTGTVNLKNANNNTFYSWNMSSVNGEVYASRSINIDWDHIQCAQTSHLTIEDEFIGANSTTDGDSIFNTFFTGQSFNGFYTGFRWINDTGCYVAHLNDEQGSRNMRFTELLMTDNSSMVYTSILNNDVLGFDNRTHDFQILLGENGHNADTAPTTYYFFIEIG